MNLRSQREKADMLLSLHRNGNLLVLPNVWNPIGARILEKKGFPAVATASAAISASLGYQDGEKIKRATAIDLIGRIARSVAVPVTADIETGYAESLSELEVTAQQVVESGAVGVNIEDGLEWGGGLRTIEDQCQRISAFRKSADRCGGQVISGRLYCSPKALWKLNWFLRDFGHQPNCLQRCFPAPTRRICIRWSLGRPFTGKSGQSAGGLNDLTATPRSANTSPARGATGIAISTAGRKKTPERRCCSAALSNERWVRSFARKIPERSCLRSGLPAKPKSCITPTETRGIACSVRESHLFQARSPTPAYPLSTLRWVPRGSSARLGARWFAILSCKTLSFSTSCRFSPAHCNGDICRKTLQTDCIVAGIFRDRSAL